jgi:(p)ppGpp synthase/HD superfamily hydrolase
MAYQSLLVQAIELATKAHEGQVDKCGNPYIEHPKRVMEMADTTEKKIVAILHDVVEDTTVSIEQIHRIFGEDIALAVDAISQRKNEPRKDYYYRVLQNGLAHSVKLLDLADNTDPKRMCSLDPDTQVRLTVKYMEAYQILTGGPFGIHS